MTSDLVEYTTEDLKTNMKAMLTELCEATAKDQRRVKLYSILNKLFPTRLKIEKQNWTNSPVKKTVNFVLPFGKSMEPEAEYIVIGAHYDAVPNVPGANDNGAAVIQLIEGAMRLQDSGKEPNIMFVFFDHEEIFGGKEMGSKLFCQQHINNLPSQAVIFDVTGIGNTFFVSGTDYTDLLWGFPQRRTPPSDNLNLSCAGIDTCLVCALPEEEFLSRSPSTWDTLHTKKDSVEVIEEETLQAGADLISLIIERYKEQQYFENLDRVV
jgi:hypothetical protein